jgi:predicted amidohydrolase
MKVVLVQFDIAWENPQANIEKMDTFIVDPEPGSVILLPEMWSTGFTMNPEKFAEEDAKGPSFAWMKSKALCHQSVVAGSLAVKTKEGLYKNRFYALLPDGSFIFYDKKHLFSLAGENLHYNPGNKKKIFEWKGWNICPQICYDIRFPVWCRNTRVADKQKLSYDVLFVVANWPESRMYPWRQLLIARAIENQSYVVAVNRVGLDGNGIAHSGNSMVINPFGEVEIEAESGKEITVEAELNISLLQKCRSSFPFWKDADDFIIK